MTRNFYFNTAYLYHCPRSPSKLFPNFPIISIRPSNLPSMPYITTFSLRNVPKNSHNPKKKKKKKKNHTHKLMKNPVIPHYTPNPSKTGREGNHHRGARWIPYPSAYTTTKGISREEWTVRYRYRSARLCWRPAAARPPSPCWPCSPGAGAPASPFSRGTPLWLAALWLSRFVSSFTDRREPPWSLA